MSDDDEVRGLIAAYATHADDGDGDAFAALFLPNARLRTWLVAGTVGSEYDGAEAIAAIPAKLAQRYDRTEHRIGDVELVLGSIEATSTSTCVAHHVRGDVDRILTIRYEDAFGRDADGRWRFASREVHVLRIDDRPFDERAVTA